ncbi:hypothetical protein E4L95_15000 [Paracoccus liaowanqingii]|uniref:Uncharacterized protein n=1 Tax=Paracoccus liaowanqingii TaxID=2560053 RepID=A0A4Z1CF09_9RHOB|nr:hypothetical protein [Paracoccus liaowanqingii]TGN55490.1 hypothetical protein E4L95_15000 [Paracoccus liaowanqingii]
MRIFEGVKAILLSPSGSLQGLADVVGQSAEELFEGESFNGIDLRDEAISLLLKIDADFTGAILTRAQTKALKNGGDARSRRLRGQGLSELQSMRYAVISSFIEKFFPEDRHYAAEVALWSPLKSGATADGNWKESVRFYAANALRFLVMEGTKLDIDSEEIVLNYLSNIKMLKLPVEAGVLSEILRLNIALPPEIFEKVFDFDCCTERFVVDWLDYIAVAYDEKEGGSLRAGSLEIDPSNASLKWSPKSGLPKIIKTSSFYLQALSLAALAPTNATLSYYESILARARSLEELRYLIYRISEKRPDASAAGLVARILAQASSDPKFITEIALDENIDVNIRNRFRYLIIASGSPEGRRALIAIIADLGEKASGIEVDSILVGLSFDESIKLMRPFWEALTLHHRAVALDAISAKVVSESERHRMKLLRDRYLN